jgi:hypothetical protein
MNADCFNDEKVNEKLKEVKKDTANTHYTIIFDDGSTLTIESKVLYSTSDSWIKSQTLKWGVLGMIDMASYTITAQWHKDPNPSRPDAVVYDYSWDDGRARTPVEIILGGTRPVYTSGDYIKVTGSCKLRWKINNIPGQITKNCEFKGYTGGYCVMNEI